LLAEAIWNWRRSRWLRFPRRGGRSSRVGDPIRHATDGGAVGGRWAVPSAYCFACRVLTSSRSDARDEQSSHGRSGRRPRSSRPPVRTRALDDGPVSRRSRGSWSIEERVVALEGTEGARTVPVRPRGADPDAGAPHGGAGRDAPRSARAGRGRSV